MTTTQTPNLDLPYIMPAQAQKHVTHNEAIRQLDAVVHLSVAAMNVISPPIDSIEGARYGVSNMPGGAWTDYADHIAVWQDGTWAYLTPQEGWTLWVVDTGDFKIFSQGAWINLLPDAPTEFDNLDHVGINASADTTNRLAVASAASLFNHNGSGHQIKVNKNSTADTASLLFQSGFSGRAEIGVLGNDALSVKTSSDGSVWQEQLAFDAGLAGLKTPALRSGDVSILPDDIATINCPAYGGIIAITQTSASGFPQSYHTGLFVYDVGPSLSLLTLTKLSGIENLGSTTLTGTTGSANKTSISVQAGTLLVENRSTQTRKYTYTFLA